MGATRESSWSDGIFVGWSCGEDACAARVEAMDARVSPGTRAMVQTIVSRCRRVLLKGFRFGFIATSALIAPSNRMSPWTRTRAPVCHLLHNVRGRLVHSRSRYVIAILSKNTVEALVDKAMSQKRERRALPTRPMARKR